MDRSKCLHIRHFRTFFVDAQKPRHGSGSPKSVNGRQRLKKFFCPLSTTALNLVSWFFQTRSIFVAPDTQERLKFLGKVGSEPSPTKALPLPARAQGPMISPALRSDLTLRRRRTSEPTRLYSLSPYYAHVTKHAWAQIGAGVICVFSLDVTPQHFLS